MLRPTKRNKDERQHMCTGLVGAALESTQILDSLPENLINFSPSHFATSSHEKMTSFSLLGDGKTEDTLYDEEALLLYPGNSISLTPTLTLAEEGAAVT